MLGFSRWLQKENQLGEHVRPLQSMCPFLFCLSSCTHASPRHLFPVKLDPCKIQCIVNDTQTSQSAARWKLLTAIWRLSICSRACGYRSLPVVFQRHRRCRRRLQLFPLPSVTTAMMRAFHLALDLFNSASV